MEENKVIERLLTEQNRSIKRIEKNVAFFFWITFIPILAGGLFFIIKFLAESQITPR